jgi:hypothetical protein
MFTAITVIGFTMLVLATTLEIGNSTLNDKQKCMIAMENFRKCG